MPQVDNIIKEFSTMYISKSSLHDGEMRWSAINSDTDWDLYGEKMTIELYRSMIGKIKANTPPPEPFAEMVTSEWWKGGMPYLSIAHYSDGNGKAVPGSVRELFIDGTQLKAKGILSNNPFGKAVWNSLKQDELNYKTSVDTDRIRISIAFLDLAHKHGISGEIFKRNSFMDKCPECQRGVGEKIYLDGYLVHLALTRVPVNPRTIMQAEDIMAKKSKPTTKKEDAVSVLGDETLAEELSQVALENKSDVMVEMSDTEDAPVEEAVVEDAKHGEEEMPMDEEEDKDEDKKEVKKKSFTPELIAEIVEAVKSSLLPEAPQPDPVPEAESPKAEKSALETSLDKLYNAVTSEVNVQKSIEEKLQAIQPALEEVGQEITNVVKKSVGETVAPSQPNPSDAILEAIQSLTQTVTTLGTEVATLKAQTLTPPATNRVPVPRSIVPQIVTKSQTPEVEEKPNSVRNVVRRSVYRQ